MFEIRRLAAGDDHYEVLFRGSFIGAIEFRGAQSSSEREACYLVYLGDGIESVVEACAFQVRRYTYSMDGGEVLVRGNHEGCEAFYDQLSPLEREQCVVVPEGMVWYKEVT